MRIWRLMAPTPHASEMLYCPDTACVIRLVQGVYGKGGTRVILAFGVPTTNKIQESPFKRDAEVAVFYDLVGMIFGTRHWYPENGIAIHRLERLMRLLVTFVDLAPWEAKYAGIVFHSDWKAAVEELTSSYGPMLVPAYGK